MAVIPHLWYLVNLCLLAEVTLDQIRVSELTKDDNLVRIWVMVPPRHDASDWGLDSYSLGVILSGRSPVWAPCQTAWSWPSPSSSRNWGFLTHGSWLNLSTIHISRHLLDLIKTWLVLFIFWPIKKQPHEHRKSAQVKWVYLMFFNAFWNSNALIDSLILAQRAIRISG